MHLRHLGYACQNRTLDCTTGRTFRLKSLSEERAVETIGENLEALLRTLRWNAEQDLRFFRISSDVIPFASHEQFPFDWRDRFTAQLEEVRAFAERHAMRLTMHPGQYTVLNSPREEVVERAVHELEYHAALLEAVDPDQGTMTLHVGGAYGDKAEATARFERNLSRLSKGARQRLILENDDTTYHLDDVLALCERTEVPMVFDYFHHRCHHVGDDYRAGLVDKLDRVAATWHGRVPKCHLSSQRPDASPRSHADFIEEDDFREFLDVMAAVDGDDPFDLMIEAKEKDRAVLALLGQEPT